MVSINKVLVYGLNAVWQRTLSFDSVVLGEVNRAQSVVEGASGKGINCASVIKALGAESEIVQFVGGETGKAVCRDLDDKGLSHSSIVMHDRTRVCTTLLDRMSGEMTELVGPSPTVTDLEMAQLTKTLVGLGDGVSGVAICGSFPQNVDVVKLASILKAFKGPVLVDGVGTVVPILENGGCVLKVNKSELLQLMNETSFEKAVKLCFDYYSPSVLAVTNEGCEAYLFLESDGGWTYELPSLDVCNSLGAGDAVSGSLFIELLRGNSSVNSLHFALAVGSASCLSLLPAQFDLDKVLQIQSNICIEEFKF